MLIVQGEQQGVSVKCMHCKESIQVQCHVGTSEFCAVAYHCFLACPFAALLVAVAALEDAAALSTK